jgi:dienelactone hydrolase
MIKTPLQTALLLTIALLIPNLGAAEIQTETINYFDGDKQLQGYVSWDDSIKGKRPGILVVHEWWGLNDYARERARMLAELGYVAFAVDMYGKGQVTTHADQANAWMSQITENIDAWQQRANLWLKQVKSHPLVDGDKTAAIGYCFGGATVMQLAYSGADIDGVVSFHGSLPAATEQQYPAIKAKIFAAHGNADPFVPAEQVTHFKASLEAAEADWQLLSFGGVKHSFTNPNAGSHGMDALAYDEDADRRSWQAMQNFFDEIFSD